MGRMSSATTTIRKAGSEYRRCVGFKPKPRSADGLTFPRVRPAHLATGKTVP